MNINSASIQDSAVSSPGLRIQNVGILLLARHRTTAQIRLAELNKVSADVIDIQALKDADVIRDDVRRVRVFLSGELKGPVTIRGLAVSRGARAAIEAAGGQVED